MVAATVRRYVSGTLALLPERQRMLVYELLKRLVPGKREALAIKYLNGNGIEVGAMHNPLRVPTGVSVQYVDYVSREANLERFTEINGSQVVVPDFIEDGFSLPSFQASSVDFLIANHVLEHTDNVIKTLLRWAEVLRPQGILFLSVPLAERCFDRGRPVTSIEHFIGDYDLERSGRTELFRENTKEHYSEWLSISLPAVVAQQGKKLGTKNREDLTKSPEELLADNVEIHFHTFSMTSYTELLAHFCAQFRPDFNVLDVVENGVEVIGILQRKG